MTTNEGVQPINWTDWIKSDEGQRCANLTTLDNYNDVYLENRLWAAFVAGAKYERDLAAMQGKKGKS